MINVKYIFFTFSRYLKIMSLMIKRFHYYSHTIYLFPSTPTCFVYIYALTLLNNMLQCSLCYFLISVKYWLKSTRNNNVTFQIDWVQTKQTNVFHLRKISLPKKLLGDYNEKFKG